METVKPVADANVQHVCGGIHDAIVTVAAVYCIVRPHMFHDVYCRGIVTSAITLPGQAYQGLLKATAYFVAMD